MVCFETCLTKFFLPDKSHTCSLIADLLPSVLGENNQEKTGLWLKGVCFSLSLVLFFSRLLQYIRRNPLLPFFYSLYPICFQQMFIFSFLVIVLINKWYGKTLSLSLPSLLKKHFCSFCQSFKASGTNTTFSFPFCHKAFWLGFPPSLWFKLTL